MYIKYIKDEQIEQFINTVTKSSVKTVSIINRSSDGESMKAYSGLLFTFKINDFECINVIQKEDCSNLWCSFMINHLDKIDKRLADRYINDLHDHLEQGTIVGPTI